MFFDSNYFRLLPCSEHAASIAGLAYEYHHFDSASQAASCSYRMAATSGRSSPKDLNKGVLKTSREIVLEVGATIQKTRSTLAGLDVRTLETKEQSKGLGTKLDLADVADRGLESLSAMKEDLRAIHWTPDEDGRFIGMKFMNDSFQEDALVMREQAEADLELTQVGMASSFVNHKFENSIKTVRTSLRRLKIMGRCE